MGKVGSIKEVDIERLKPYERNAKTHSLNQIEKIKDSIAEFGFLTPCLIDKDYNLIAGHGRVEAAREIGLKKIPCVFIDGLSDEQRRAYILADNRIAELGGWDMDKVDIELADLDELGFDVSLTGFEFTLDDIDENTSEASDGIGYRITYELAFDNEEQQERWHYFIRELKRRMPEKDTIAERVLEVAEVWLNG